MGVEWIRKSIVCLSIYLSTYLHVYVPIDVIFIRKAEIELLSQFKLALSSLVSLK
jgi:hypothetical protein